MPTRPNENHSNRAKQTEMRTLDLDYLDTSLKPLEGAKLTIFTACCASRLLPAYHSFSQRTKMGKPEILQKYLETVWGALTETGMHDVDQHSNLSDIEILMPKEIDNTPLLEYAADSVAAVKCAIRCCLFGDFEDATLGAQCVQECVARFLQNTNPFQHKQGSEMIDELGTYSLMQKECARQERDIEELRNIKVPLTTDCVGYFRSRSESEPALPELEANFEPIYRLW